MTVEGPDVMWLAKPGIIHNEGAFVFKVFTWIDFRASYPAQESVAMIQPRYLFGDL